APAPGRGDARRTAWPDGPGEEPGRGPHPAFLHRRDRGEAAHQLLPGGCRRPAVAHHQLQVRFAQRAGPAEAAPLPRDLRLRAAHLRVGPVARGGLRWSGRREDVRTEVLGLVKAQMVKNTGIVPVGAKGGFCAKRPPAGGDRDTILAEGIACYRMFIGGLLTITDNIVDGEIVPPRDVVRHDQDDPYLVVAADKGTASFSDIANEIATSHGF